MGRKSIEGGRVEKLESKEAEKLPPLTFIYRENDLFKKWIPVIESSLKAIGRDTETHEFPRGTEEKKIQEWLEKNKKKYTDKEIFPDGTVSGKLQDSLLWRSYKTTEAGSIDSILSDATTRVLFGKNETEWREDIQNETYEGSLETAEKSFTVMIKEILNKTKPEKINIYLSHILEHEPFSWIKYEKPEGERNEAEDYETAKAQIKNWFIKGGIDEGKIVFNAEEDFKKIKESIEKDKGGSDNWLIFDRHLLGDLEKEHGKIETDSIKLQLPLENFLHDAMQNNLLQIDPSKVEEELRQVLKERFDKDTEKE